VRRAMHYNQFYIISSYIKGSSFTVDDW
jgi:hypothetical protein